MDTSGLEVAVKPSQNGHSRSIRDRVGETHASRVLTCLGSHWQTSATNSKQRSVSVYRLACSVHEHSAQICWAFDGGPDKLPWPTTPMTRRMDMVRRKSSIVHATLDAPRTTDVDGHSSLLRNQV